MNLVESISEIPNDKILETWYNSVVIFEGLKEFLDNTVSGLADENGYQVTNNQTHSRNFTDKEMFISCWGSFIKESVWDKYFNWLALGIEINDKNEFDFYVWLKLTIEFDTRYFDSNAKAKVLRQKMHADSWTFNWDEDEECWLIYKTKPVDKFDLSKPTWKKDVKRFYEDCLTEMTDTIFVTKNWLD